MFRNPARVAAVAAVCLALVAVGSARAVTVPLLFPGSGGTLPSAETFNGSVGLNGSIQAGGTATVFGIPVTISNQTIPVSLKGTPSVSSNPMSYDALGTGNLTGVGTNQLVDTNALDLDLLNGQS